MQKFGNTLITNQGRAMLTAVDGAQGKLTYTKAILSTQDTKSMSDDNVRALEQLSDDMLEASINVVDLQDNTVTIGVSFNNAQVKQDLKFNSIGWFAKTSVDSKEKLLAVTPSETEQILVAGSNGQSTASTDIELVMARNHNTTVTVNPTAVGLIDNEQLESAINSAKSQLNNDVDSKLVDVNKKVDSKVSTSDYTNKTTAITQTLDDQSKRLDNVEKVKADSSSVYTQDQINSQMSTKADKSALSDLSNKVNTNIQHDIDGLKNTLDWKTVDGVNVDTITYTSKLFLTNPSSVPEDSSNWSYLITNRGNDDPNRVTQEWWSDDEDTGRTAQHYYRQITYDNNQNWSPWLAQATQNDVDSINSKISKLGSVKTVNHTSPDDSGNIQIDTDGKVKTVNGAQPDSGGNISIAIPDISNLQSQVNSGFSARDTQINNAASLAKEAQETANTKANASNVYTKQQTDGKLGQKITFVKCDSPQAAADVSSKPADDGSIVIGIYDMNDEPSQAVVGDQKINIEWLYNHLTGLQTQVSGLNNLQSLINGKADSATVYTKIQVDQMIKALINDKANISDVYTKSQVDSKTSGTVVTAYDIADKSVTSKTDSYTNKWLVDSGVLGQFADAINDINGTWNRYTHNDGFDLLTLWGQYGIHYCLNSNMTNAPDWFTDKRGTAFVFKFDSNSQTIIYASCIGCGLTYYNKLEGKWHKLATDSDITNLQNQINQQNQTIQSLITRLTNAENEINYIKANYIEGKQFPASQASQATAWENANPQRIAFITDK